MNAKRKTLLKILVIPLPLTVFFLPVVILGLDYSLGQIIKGINETDSFKETLIN